MSYCSECGSDIGNSKICPVCNTVNENYSDFSYQENSVVQQEFESEILPDDFEGVNLPVLFDERQYKINKLKKIMVAVCSLVCIIALISVFSFSGNGPKNITEKTLNAIKTADISTIIQAVPFEHIYGNNNYKSSVYTSYSHQYQIAYMQIKAFWGMDLNNITWQIKKIKDYDEDELENIQDAWDDNYDIEIKDAKTVKVKIFDGQNDKNINFEVVKIGGKWYMTDNPLSFFNN